MVFDDNHSIAKWRWGLDWKERSQNRECLRQKRKRYECEQSRTLHVRRDEHFTEGLTFVCNRAEKLRDNVLPPTRARA